MDELEPEPIDGHVMTEEETDRMCILSWWASYSRTRPEDGV
jgi:hypothetical protein